MLRYPSGGLDRETLQEENKKIFKTVWYCIGLLDQLQNNNDFITIKVSNTSIVIQNFEGEIRAFANVCSHRGSILQRSKSGNRDLKCQYHGWKYDKQGIPQVSNKLIRESPESKCLKKYELEIVGQFIFIKIINSNLSIDTFLGDAKLKLLQISEAMDRFIGEYECLYNANWKIIIENTLEGYHIPTVHSQTFAKIGLKTVSKITNNYNDTHSDHLVETSETYKKHQLKLKRFIREKKLDHEGFYHLALFPNITIGSLYGTTVYIGLLEPSDHNKTLFRYRLYHTAKYTEPSTEIASIIGTQAIEFTKKVIEEDREICELTHEGMLSSEFFEPTITTLEQRIEIFQRAYRRFMT